MLRNNYITDFPGATLYLRSVQFSYFFLANILSFNYNDTMKKGIYILPNGLTLCGMFFGFYSILSAIKGNYVHAAWAIMIADVFDGLDGWVARLTHSTTRFGIELDSLSDLVAFGVAPAVMIYKWSIAPFGRIGIAAAFLFAACGALRLARYNVQMGSTESKAFTGMPIPGAASVLASLVIFYYEFWDRSAREEYLRASPYDSVWRCLWSAPSSFMP